MHILTTLDDLYRYQASLSSSLGFVPTMGALHQGHLSLVKASKQQSSHTLVSIFVNPLQFGPNEDYDAYPRPQDQDIEYLKQEKVDAVFIPTPSLLYPNGLESATVVDIPHLSGLYCGLTRENFFKGILSIVLRLFLLIKPNKAFFGEKDFQQLTLIKKMCDDLFLTIDVIGCPIIREESGLAMSSRNQYLSTEELEEAATIYRMLTLGKTLSNQRSDAQTIITQMTDFIKSNCDIQPDYLDIISEKTLMPLQQIEPGSRILFGGYLNKTRLIDNIAL